MHIAAVTAKLSKCGMKRKALYTQTVTLRWCVIQTQVDAFSACSHLRLGFASLKVRTAPCLVWCRFQGIPSVIQNEKKKSSKLRQWITFAKNKRFVMRSPEEVTYIFFFIFIPPDTYLRHPLFASVRSPFHHSWQPSVHGHHDIWHVVLPFWRVTRPLAAAFSSLRSAKLISDVARGCVAMLFVFLNLSFFFL